MDPSPQSRRAREIFETALDRDSKGEHEAYIRQECGDDAVLLGQVQALVEAHEAGESFLPGQPGGPHRGGVTEQPGQMIGRYRLLEKIGEGGCGVVYMAEQEEPVRRRVALKIIKLGMDTRSVIARFEAERQALALMDHPNIAKVLEAGAAETGRPYFVMELVGGIKITDYCEQNHLDTRQRLDLFIQVCRAIQHAHQKGVIHRDIKPSNVLVATQDGVAVPKVIDFGIAKATQGRLADDTVFTAFEQFLGTPAYMSPEQAQVGGLDVDTRSDIYSLGVMLYELLTGKTPFDAKELLAVGLEAMRQTICEEEPPTPSTRLKQEVVAQQVQSSDQSKIQNQKSKIANDLDWIVMKCLEKDRGRRYETANGLARDIERHLNNEPVAAGPPSQLYRFRKLVRRNSGAAFATAVVAVVLVAGTFVSTWQAVRAQHAELKAENAQENETKERKKAQTEATKSKQVAQFLQDMLQGVGPSKALGRDTAMLHEILDKTAERLGKELTNQPDVEIELREILAKTYDELGLHKEMEQMAREELRLARAHLGEDNIAVAHALITLGNAQYRLSDYEQSENCARAALRLFQKLLGTENTEVAGAMNSLGLVLQARSKLAEAEAIHRDALAMLRKASGNESIEVANSMGILAYTLQEEGKLAEAEALSRESLALQRKLKGNEHPEVATTLSGLGLILQGEAKFAEAELVHREGLAMRRKLLGNEHPGVASSLLSLATALRPQGKLPEAEAMACDALTLYRNRLGNENREVGMALNLLGNVQQDQGKLAEAEATHREALEIKRKLLGPEHADIAASLNNLARALRAEGKLAEAEATHRETLGMIRKLVGDNDPRTSFSRANLAFVLEEQGKLSEAEGLYRESLSAQRRLFSEDHPEVSRNVSHLARVLLRQDKFAEAETLCRAHLPFMRSRVTPDSTTLAWLITQLASALLSEGKFSDAEPLARECLVIHERKNPDHWVTFYARRILGSSLLGQRKYTEAGPLLLSGYEGMKDRAAKIPSESKVQIKKALQDTVQLYEATGQTNQAAQWKQKLNEFERTQTNPIAPGSTPP